MSHLASMLFKNSRLKDLLIITLIVKVTLLGVIYLAAQLLPFCYECYSNDLAYLPVKEWSPWLSFCTWDARHYSYLVDTGYHGDNASNAFYPLFPVLVFLLKFIIPHTLIAGFIVSNIASIVAMILFFLVVKSYWNEEVAFHSGLFLLLFPTGFYLTLMYSESLFLALVFGFFYLWKKEEYIGASLAAFLLSLSRPLGVLMIVPVIAEVVMTACQTRKVGTSLKQEACLILGSMSGFAAYLYFMYVTTGSMWAGLDAQRFFIADNSINHLFHPWQWFQANFVNIELTLHSFTNSLIDRIFFVGYLVALFCTYKLLPKRFFWYALVMGLVPALLGFFMAYTRYVLVVFPLFIVLALVCGKKSPYVVIPMVMLQVLFLLMHILNFWVA